MKTMKLESSGPGYGPKPKQKLSVMPVAPESDSGDLTIPHALQVRLIEVLRTAHDNALEAHQDAHARYKGYKQRRIDALEAEAVEAEMVLFEILKLKENT